METKRTRYITRIFTLDQSYEDTSFTSWKNELEDFLQTEYKNYGLKIISDKEELFIKIEYSNIAWEYKCFFGTYKKRYSPLQVNDERWSFIENGLKEDLKMMGLENLKDEVLISLKNKNYFEYREKSEEQFKNYCL